MAIVLNAVQSAFIKAGHNQVVIENADLNEDFLVATTIVGVRDLYMRHVDGKIINGALVFRGNKFASEDVHFNFIVFGVNL